MTRLKSIWSICVKSIKGFMADGAPRLAAAVSFYTALSLGPLLTLILTLLGIFLGDEAARGLLVDEIESVTDRKSALFIQSMIGKMDTMHLGGWSSLLSGGILIWGATRLFYEIQEALGLILDSSKDKQALKTVVKRRAVALGMCLVVAFLLLVSLILNSVLSFAIESIRFELPGKDWLWLVTSSVSSFILIASLFAALYRWLPLAKVKWKNAFWGALVAAGLFTLGRDLFGLYLSRQDDVQGAAGALIAVLLWVYFSAQVFFLGAEVGKVVESGDSAKNS